MNTAVNTVKGLVNLLYPLHCASCGRYMPSTDAYGVCPSCLAGIKRNPKPCCRLCGRHIPIAEDACPECRKMRPVFSSARSACLYEGVLKELIHKLKYDNARGLSRVLASIMLDFIKDDAGIADGADIITFVPLHRKKFVERLYNQSELLARYIGPSLGIPVKRCIGKASATRSQNELPRDERLSNLAGSFAALRGSENIVEGSDILIVDDVMTTGSTLNECARALLDAGARRVRCLTLARGA